MGKNPILTSIFNWAAQPPTSYIPSENDVLLFFSTCLWFAVIPFDTETI